MTKISMTTDLDVSADEVWKLIGGFNALPDWHPEVEKSELEEEGQVRKLSLAGGGTSGRSASSRWDIRAISGCAKGSPGAGTGAGVVKRVLNQFVMVFSLVSDIRNMGSPLRFLNCTLSAPAFRISEWIT